jgi:Cys-rich peptide (Clo7bot family)
MKYVVNPVKKFELAYCNGCSSNACNGYNTCNVKGNKVSVTVKV